MKEIEEILLAIRRIVAVENSRKKVTAKDFNIFQILGLTSDEVRLHSRFIAELLDPNGSHGQGTYFLDRFLKYTGSTGTLQNLETVKISVEHYIGPVTSTSGGQIDILVWDNANNVVIIENKIYAGDQDNQLLRYFNYAKNFEKKGGQYALIYLTLHKQNASDKSLGETLSHRDYISVSYQETIVNWLEDCLKGLVDIPKLSIGLTHYIQLIKQLTYQDFDMNLQQQTIAEINKDVETFIAAEQIGSSLLNAKVELLNSVGLELKSKIESLKEVSEVYMSSHFGQQYQGLEIFLDENIDLKNRLPHIRFSFLRNAHSPYIEIHPGLIDGHAVPKNHDKRMKYSRLLNVHFNGNIGKIFNVEKYWQGEWVMEYYRFNNRFTDIIQNRDRVVNEVFEDLKIIIETFYALENDIIKLQ